MAIRLQSKPNVIAPASPYPYGRIKDNPGDGSGTPVNEQVYGDFHQFFAKLLADAGITGNDLSENSTNTFQYILALNSIIATAVGVETSARVAAVSAEQSARIAADSALNTAKVNKSGDTITGDLFVDGNLELTSIAAGSSNLKIDAGGGFANDGPSFLLGGFATDVTGPLFGVKKISTTWNMDSTPNIVIAHGLGGGWVNILSVFVMVKDNTSSLAMNLDYSGSHDVDGTNFNLRRVNVGLFDDPSYNAATITLYITFGS